jgi:hypothetical protein
VINGGAGAPVASIARSRTDLRAMPWASQAKHPKQPPPSDRNAAIAAA